MTESSTLVEENVKSTQERFNLISNDIESHEFKDGETGYLLSNKWYSRFKRSAKQNNNTDFNLPIDNNHLFNEDKEIKQWVIRNRDYIIISDKAWNLLSKWFQITGPSKEVLTLKDPLKQNLVFDVAPTPYIINYIKPDDNEKISSKQVYISKYATVGDLKLKALKECGLYNEKDANTDSRLRDYFNQNAREELKDERTLLSYNFTYEPDLLLEKKNEQGKWTQLKPQRHISSRKNSQSNNGKVGLANNINQCYQLSILQALGHCRPFLDFITNEKYENNNKSNIETLRNIRYYMKQMWNNETKTVLNFQRLIYKDTFQHDAHEFLILLLSYLIGESNSDPNIKETQTPKLTHGDGTKSNDQILYKKNWELFLSQNQTQLFPMFNFLSSRRFQCLECSKATNVFEVQSTFEIPFETLIKKQQTIVWIPYSSSNHPLKFVIKTNTENGTDDDFRNKICDFLTTNKFDYEKGANSTMAFAYIKDENQTGNSPTAPLINNNFISGSSSTEILTFKPNFIFSNAQIVPGNLFAFEIPDKNKSYFLVTFPIPNFGQTLINSFICQFENEESEEEAKRIAIEHLKRTLYSQLFKIEDETNENQSVFISATVSGSLVQDDRYQFLYKLTVNVQLKLNEKMDKRSRLLEEINKVSECDITDILKEQSITRIFDTTRHCDICNKDTKCSVSNHFWVFPEVFIIHIVPYLEVDNSLIQRVPIKITFPEILEINDSMMEITTGEKIKYKLFAVVVHIHFNIDGGHYYTYAYHDKRKEWFLFNDASVSEVKLSEVLHADPFLLFYQKIHDE